MAAVEVVDTINFGRVRSGERLSRTFAIKNSSTEMPMVILTTETSCGCLWLDYPKESISAGSSAVVEMNFDSSGYTYFVPRAFYIYTSLSEKGKKLVVMADVE